MQELLQEKDSKIRELERLLTESKEKQSDARNEVN